MQVCYFLMAGANIVCNWATPAWKGLAMMPSNRSSHSLRSFLAILAPVALALAACSQLPSESTAAASAPAASPRTSSTPSDVQLFFDSGGSTLSAAADQKLDEVAPLYRGGHPLVMFVAGHADTTGSENPNLRRSA